MYLDTKHLVTVGIGFLIEDPKSKSLMRDVVGDMKFINRATRHPASMAEIQDDFDRVKAAQPPANMSYREFHRFFERQTKLSLDADFIEQRFQELIEHFRAELRKEFPLYDTYPRSAQYALLDMIFNLGRGTDVVKKKHGKVVSVKRTGIHAYRQMRAALDAKPIDWDQVASRCYRHGIGESRNKETQNWFHHAKEEHRPSAPNRPAPNTSKSNSPMT